MISVIIPVYNTEEYIDACIESVIQQSYRDLEIVIVDDGSTDSSGAKCDEWAKRDSRIRVFHKSNGGLMSAWKYGVNRSSGQYIGFMDSDDWIDPDMYETLLRHMQKENAELALCGLIAEYESGQPSIRETLSLNKSVYDRADIVNHIYPMAICAGQAGVRGLSANRVTKLYSRPLIVRAMENCPDNVSIGEDLVSTVSAITQCCRLCMVHNFYPYHYRIHDASMMQIYSDLKYERIKNLHIALTIINEKNDGIFADQIAIDYVNLIFQTIDQEILLSNYSYSRVKRDIKRETMSATFMDSCKRMDNNKLNRKQKLYMFLIRLHLWGGIIFARKAYSRARVPFCK